MTTKLRLLFALALASQATSAFACETQPDISQLPGETAKDASERFQKTFYDQGVIGAYEHERFGLDHATVIYIGTVIKSDPRLLDRESNVLPTATVQPLGSIKGDLPKQNRKLAMTGQTSCGNRGDGDAAAASIGTLVVVFEGLPKSEWRPNGMDSIRATDARTFELLDPLYAYGKPIPSPWDK